MSVRNIAIGKVSQSGSKGEAFKKELDAATSPEGLLRVNGNEKDEVDDINGMHD